MAAASNYKNYLSKHRNYLGRIIKKGTPISKIKPFFNKKTNIMFYLEGGQVKGEPYYVDSGTLLYLNDQHEVNKIKASIVSNPSKDKAVLYYDSRDEFSDSFRTTSTKIMVPYLENKEFTIMFSPEKYALDDVPDNFKKGGKKRTYKKRKTKHRRKRIKSKSKSKYKTYKKKR